jgi:hypothetical protein
MFAHSLKEVEQAWSAVDGVKRVSDRIVGLGPFGIGLDGILAMANLAPGGFAIDELYTLGAGGYIVFQGLKARASPGVITRMIVYLAADTVLSGVGVVPIIGGVLGAGLDFFFQGHLYAAKALQKEIERTHWVEASWREAKASGELNRHLAEAKAQRKKRVVFLHD